MKRIIALLLTAALICPLASCQSAEQGGETSAADQTTESTVETTRETALADNLDFGGETINFLCRKDEGNTSYINEIGALEITGDVIDDAIYQRNRSVEQRLNVVINPINMNGYWDNQKEFLGRVRNSVSSGDNEYDVVVGYAAYISPLATEGMLRNLSDAPHIDYDRPWWNSSIIENGSVKGKSYFVAGDIGLSCLSSAFAIYFNKRIADELSINDLYDLVRSGKWTKEKADEYTKLAAADLNGDGQMDFDNDRWGFVANQASEYGAAFNLRLTSNQNGEPKLDFDMEKMTDALTWLNKFFYENEGAAPIDAVSTSWTISLGMFEDGRSLFYSSHLGRIIYLRGMQDDFGVLPVFKWDENQADYQTTTHDGLSLFSVPVTCEHFEATCATMEALAEEGYYSVQPAFYDVALQGKFTRDEESGEMMDIIKNNITFTFEMIYASSMNYMQNMINELAKSQNTNFASYHATYENTWQASLDKLVETLSGLEH